MNAEIQQQLYGGEIGDYFKSNLPPSKYVESNNTLDTLSDNKLEAIYNTQVKDRGSIDTSGIYRSNNVPLEALIQREPDKFQQMLTDTLNQVAKDIGLIPNSSSGSLPSVTPKEQTVNDLQQAQDNIAQALQELKDLNAI